MIPRVLNMQFPSGSSGRFVTPFGTFCLFCRHTAVCDSIMFGGSKVSPWEVRLRLPAVVFARSVVIFCGGIVDPLPSTNATAHTFYWSTLRTTHDRAVCRFAEVLYQKLVEASFEKKGTRLCVSIRLDIRMGRLISVLLMHCCELGVRHWVWTHLYLTRH